MRALAAQATERNQGGPDSNVLPAVAAPIGADLGPCLEFVRGPLHPHAVTCVVSWPGDQPLLADVVPVFEHLGLRLAAAGEPAQLAPGELRTVSRLEFRTADAWDDTTMTAVEDAFLAAARGHYVIDAFSRLIPEAGISWAEAKLVCLATRYLKLAGLGLSNSYVLATLRRHPDFVRAFAALFHARFDPERIDRHAAERQAERDLDLVLEITATLDEDKILRALRSFVEALLRTNWFQRAEDGQWKRYSAFKLDPSRLSLRSPITPHREIFVHSPEVDGIHVRSDLVARGGVRWSDRPEDFRAEVLGLMKTQRIKNSVIVPDGAKGAFVVRDGADPAVAYDTFIRGLLDVSDNLVDGAVKAPASTLARDDPDPYLVVAADRGTARFSDRANAVAAGYGFWLGDAFASGGSAGYDHKAMGITARGVWVAVRRHFSELGVDLDRQTISVTGIGDMSGDVFGNGMLLSNRVRLVAAFDHRHVFLDPDPDPETSFTERSRLAVLPASSWADYDAALISPGGGVWPRTAKRIPLSARIRDRLGLIAESLPPHEVIRAILRAPVDLLFNGGVGTYVKARDEAHSEAADPGNDLVRVDAAELRCRVAGEGGNLGFTQRARVEFALAGGRINGDFIDNAAGVHTSDYEVNLKILLEEATTAAELDPGERDGLLAAAAGDVQAAVLGAADRQGLALSLTEAHAPFLLDRHARLLRQLERAYGLERALEVLPTEPQLAARARDNLGLTRPEIAVLLAHSKNVVRDDLLGSAVLDDPIFRPALTGYFPVEIRHRFGDRIPQHRLGPEIIATCVANDLVDHMGPGFVFRMEEHLGAGTAEVALAFAVTREIVDLDPLWTSVAEAGLPAAPTLQILHRVQDLVGRVSSWLLRNRGPALRDPRAEVQRSKEGFAALIAEVPALLAGSRASEPSTALGLPAELEDRLEALVLLSKTMDVVELARESGVPARDVLAGFLQLVSELDLGFIERSLDDVPGSSHWTSMATARLRDEFALAQSELVAAALHDRVNGPFAGETVAGWLTGKGSALRRFQDTVAELRIHPRLDLPMASTVVAELRLLAQRGIVRRKESR
ncbi:NAD-glutamate dehydrogenase [Amycolatopsis sp. H6(2020)]|nr:NAD-glutamate dehydrogenase [Amycolatopsis sp. H6(2020)]